MRQDSSSIRTKCGARERLGELWLLSGGERLFFSDILKFKVPDNCTLESIIETYISEITVPRQKMKSPSDNCWRHL